jgi:hypothetical protein
MPTRSEKVFCSIRTSNSDLVLTSERVICQSLPFSATFQHFLARALTATLVPLEAILGSARYSAWEEGCDKVLGGGSARPPLDPQEVIQPQRITQSIPYAEITEVRMERSAGGGWVYGDICAGETSLPFAVDEDRFSPLWHFLSPILADRIVFPGKEEMSNLRRIWLTDLCRYLSGLGFQTEIADILPYEPERGLIKFQRANLAVLAKEKLLGACWLRFAVEGVRGKVDRAALISGTDSEEAGACEWKGKRLAQVLSRDPGLTEKLLSWRRGQPVRIGISHVKTKGQFQIGNLPPHRLQSYVEIEDESVERLPPREYFEAIDSIAHHIRSM